MLNFDFYLLIQKELCFKDFTNYNSNNIQKMYIFWCTDQVVMFVERNTKRQIHGRMNRMRNSGVTNIGLLSSDFWYTWQVSHKYLFVDYFCSFINVWRGQLIYMYDSERWNTGNHDFIHAVLKRFKWTLQCISNVHYVFVMRSLICLTITPSLRASFPSVTHD